MNLNKECIRKIKVKGVTYYQVPELARDDCMGCAIDGTYGCKSNTCHMLFSIDACQSGVWITATTKEQYLTAQVLKRLEGETP